MEHLQFLEVFFKMAAWSLGVMNWYGIDIMFVGKVMPRKFIELILNWFTWHSWDSPVVQIIFFSLPFRAPAVEKPWNRMILGHHLRKNGRFKSSRIWEIFLFQYIHPTWPNSDGDVHTVEDFCCFLPWLRLWVLFFSPLRWLTHWFSSRLQENINM